MSPTPSSRRFHGANIASMACSALQLISTQRRHMGLQAFLAHNTTVFRVATYASFLGQFGILAMANRGHGFATRELGACQQQK